MIRRSFSHRIACIFALVVLYLPLGGCSQSSSSGVQPGGAVVSDEVEAANKAAQEAYDAEAKSKKKR